MQRSDFILFPADVFAAMKKVTSNNWLALALCAVGLFALHVGSSYLSAESYLGFAELDVLQHSVLADIFIYLIAGGALLCLGGFLIWVRPDSLWHFLRLSTLLFGFLVALEIAFSLLTHFAVQISMPLGMVLYIIGAIVVAAYSTCLLANIVVRKEFGMRVYSEVFRFVFALSVAQVLLLYLLSTILGGYAAGSEAVNIAVFFLHEGLTAITSMLVLIACVALLSLMETGI